MNWTKEEIDILKEFYPTRGGIWCGNQLNKSSQQIKNKASRLGLYTKYRQGKLPVKIIHRIDDTNVTAYCSVHGLCPHISKIYGT